MLGSACWVLGGGGAVLDCGLLEGCLVRIADSEAE